MGQGIPVSEGFTAAHKQKPSLPTPNLRGPVLSRLLGKLLFALLVPDFFEINIQHLDVD